MIKINDSTDISYLEVTYEGIIDADQIIAYIREIAKRSKGETHFRILTDASRAKYQMKMSDTKRVVTILTEVLAGINFIKSAFIHAGTVETALSVMLGNKNFKNYYHCVFSTKKEALRWLMNE